MAFGGAALVIAQLFAFLLPTAASALTPTAQDSVYPRGTAGFFGSPGSSRLIPVSGMIASPSGNGYLVLDRSGALLAYGDAANYGSAYFGYSPDYPNYNEAVGIGRDSATGGYWILSKLGYVYGYNAPNYGYSYQSAGDMVALLPMPSGNGYRLVSASGGVFVYGAAAFYGSTGNLHLPAPIVGGATSASGNGYWLLDAQGNIYSFGDASFFGSGAGLGKTFAAMVAKPDGTGYWLVATDGTIVNKGSAGAFSGITSSEPMAAAAVTPDGAGLWAVSTTVPPPGAIQGIVTSGTATVPNICVTGQGDRYPYTVTTRTTSTGFYKLANLKGSTYRVLFEDCDKGFYVPQWYKNAATYQAATAVTVSPGATTSPISANLVAAGVITGAAETQNGAPYWYAGACVTAYNANGVVSGTAMQPVTGTYRIGGLKAGSYTVSFRDCSTGEYLPTWYGGTDNQAAAKTATVTAKQITGDINGILPLGGSIAGVIKNGSGTPLANVCVAVIDSRNGTRVDQYNGVSGSYVTSTTGYYRIPGLRTGSYLVNFSECSGSTYAPQWSRARASEDLADPAAVTAGSRTTVNATLAKAAAISGLVKNTAGAVVANVCVTATGTDSDVPFSSTARTTSTGFYVIHGLAATGYRVQFNTCGLSGLAQPWWNGKQSAATADLATPPAAGTKTGVNGTLQPAGTLSGVVKNTSGSVRPNVCVSAWAPDGTTMVASAITTSTGFYRVGSLSAGDYKVRFGGCATSANALQWWSAKANWSTGDLVHVATGADTGGISPLLSTQSALTGVVSSARGPYVGAVVRLIDADGIEIASPVTTTATGFYRFNGLNAASYHLRVDPPTSFGSMAPAGYGTGLGTASDESGLASYESPTPIAVAASTTATANVTLLVAVPGSPTGVSATAASGRATVSWTPPASEGTSPVTGYIVTALAGGVPQRSISVPAPTTSVVVSGLSNGVAYTFTVQAVNSTGQSAPSAASAAVTPTLTATLTVPVHTTDPLIVRFNDDVRTVTTTNVVIRVTGSSVNIVGTLACTNASAAAVSCSTGPVRTATFTPSSALVAGSGYTATVNPSGVTPVRDFAANRVPTTSAAFTPSAP